MRFLINCCMISPVVLMTGCTLLSVGSSRGFKDAEVGELQEYENSILYMTQDINNLECEVESLREEVSELRNKVNKK